jgi:hypothetical protein
MSDPRPSQDTILPSVQYPDTGSALLPVATTSDTPAFDSNQTSLVPGTQGGEGEERSITNDFSLGQSGIAGPSPPFHTLHGKVACQTCVSRTSVCRSDV